MKQLIEYINESMTGWKKTSYGYLKTVTNQQTGNIVGSAIVNKHGSKYSILLKYDGYSGGVMDRIDDLTKDEAIKRGDEFLKNPKEYFDKQ